MPKGTNAVYRCHRVDRSSFVDRSHGLVWSLLLFFLWSSFQIVLRRLAYAMPMMVRNPEFFKFLILVSRLILIVLSVRVRFCNKPPRQCCLKCLAYTTSQSSLKCLKHAALIVWVMLFVFFRFFRLFPSLILSRKTSIFLLLGGLAISGFL